MDTENYCFCDLAPLYALDMLDEAERAWVEQQAEADPDLAEELALYQSVATTMAYSVPPQSLATDLKNRLFEQLGLAPPEPSLAVNPMSYLAVRSQDLNWQPHPAPGISVAIVHIDEVKREMIGFLRAEPGRRYPLHRHAAMEEIFMIEGDLVIEDAVYYAGDYIRSYPGSSHAPHSNTGCRFFFRTSLDDEYLEPMGIASSRL
jgi:anti-sigma factor ChrR (cupin superfamily)